MPIQVTIQSTSTYISQQEDARAALKEAQDGKLEATSLQETNRTQKLPQTAAQRTQPAQSAAST